MDIPDSDGGDLFRRNYVSPASLLWDDSATLDSRNPPSDFISDPPCNTSLPMHDLDFLKIAPGTASLKISLPDDITVTISDIDPAAIVEHCPLLYCTFEVSESGQPRASIDAPSLLAAISFLRFCYTGSYMPNWDSVLENSNCSLLLHAQLCHIGKNYDAPILETTAHGNVILETERSCSRPSAPPDLCETIRYIFKYLPEHKPLIDTIVHYCVNCFHYHGLGTDPEFRSMAYELQEFTRELSRINMERDFLDEGASEIIQLRTLPTEHSDTRFSRRVLGDFVHEIFSSDSSTPFDTPSSTPHLSAQRDAYQLPLRPRADYLLVPKSNGAFEDPSYLSEDEAHFGFTLVHRPRDNATTFVEADTGNKYCAYDDSDTETLTGRESPLLVGSSDDLPIQQIAIPEAESSSAAAARQPISTTSSSSSSSRPHLMSSPSGSDEDSEWEFIV